MKIPVQFMVVGANGLNGKNVQCHVEALIRPELEYVIIQLQNSVAMIVLWMAQVPLKLNDVMKTHAQLMEDSAIGMNGQHALLNAEAETKQELDDATTLYQNLVVWNARVTLQNANVATWILVHRLALHKHSEESLFQIDILKRF